jgi:two-component system, NtrC family, sensor kinase
MAAEANILVVDDEQGMRDMMGFELTQRGHQIVQAANGSEALGYLERSEFVLVITDVRMPLVDGIEVLKSAKAAAPNTEVIIVTGYAELESAVECLREGAFDLIQKPFHLDDFLSSVDRAIEHRRLRATTRLYEACQEILEGRKEKPLVERIAETAIRLLGADDVSVMLLDSNHCLRIVYASGIPEAVQAETRLALGERVAGRVALDNLPAILPESLRDDQRFTELESYGRVRSGIIYPLRVRETILGVINLNRIESPQRFHRADIEAAGIVAAQAALALQNERLAQNLVTSERMGAIGLFATGIVHEITNPLVYITANTAFVRNTLLSQPRDTFGRYQVSQDTAKEMEEALLDVRNGAIRIQEIMTDMRSLSRRDPEEKERFDVNKAINSAFRIARPTLGYKAKLTTELGDDLTVVGSSGQLSQVVLNLLVNAAQALESAATTDGKITVCSRREGAKILVEVIDNGPGIPPMQLSRIMEPFYTTKSKEKGSGLGLSISREIVEHHGGTLHVRSKVDEGATFTIALPAALSENQEADAIPAVTAEQEERRPRDTPHRRQNKR